MTIQVFEHQTLKIGEVDGFSKAIWEAMIRFNNRNGNRFFTIIHNGIKFRQYVGVLQIGKLTIEILPKADAAEEGNKNEWQKVLIELLRVCNLLKISHLSNANLRLKQNFILDLYFELFIKEVEKLLHQGLNKNYKYKSDNQFVMKGRLNFQKQMQFNIVQKNRFYTTHQVYNYNHLINQIIGKTISVLSQTTTNVTLLDKLKRLAIYFPKVDEISITEKVFEQIIYDRKTERFRIALEIAKLILLNYNPDIISGKNPIIAILFDMNVLFETYVFRKLQELTTSKNVKIIGQPSRKFWNHKYLKPDIVIEKGVERYILDTKWKILKTTSPNDTDLRQMFAYANVFEAKKAILIYPKVIDKQEDITGFFNQKRYENLLSCDVHFSEIITKTADKKLKLNSLIGKNILDLLN